MKRPSLRASTKLALAGAAALAIICACALWWLRGVPPSQPPAPSATPHQDAQLAEDIPPGGANIPATEARDAPLWIRWPAGLKRIYRVEYEERAAASDFGPETLGGHAKIVAVCSIEAFADPDMLRLEWGIERVENAELAFGPSEGGNNSEYQQVLQGARAVIELDAQNRVLAVKAELNTPRPVAQLIDLWARALQWPEPAPDKNAWSEMLNTGLGMASSRLFVERAEQDAGLLLLRAERDGADYASLHFSLGSGTEPIRGAGQLDARVQDGSLDRVVWRERLQRAGARGAGQVRLSFRELSLVAQLVGSEQRAAPRRLEYPENLTLAQDLPSLADQNAWRSRAAGMTWDKMREDLLRHSAGGQMPDHNRWLWRATGLLRLQPELAAELALLFFDEDLHGPGKAVVVDMLTGVGHPEAQAALRSIFSSSEARQRSDFGELVQRAGLLAAPEPATAEVLAHSLQSPVSGPEQRATAAALGAVAGKLRKNHPELAARHVESLVALANTPHEPGLERAALTGLGNSSHPAAQAAILERANAEASDLRALAARALRTQIGPKVDQALLNLTQDPSGAVQMAAITAFKERALSPDVLDGLVHALSSPALGEPAAQVLLQLATGWAEQMDSTDMEGLAKALANRAWSDNKSTHQAMNLLRALGLAQ